ncbi:Diacylglycerol kinase beta [Trichinella pseudospiralis]|uniref:Diacylglycerol kinase n=1 Tax=Trichinella pseudospiralis TaxID=6337 RepID=A0A0V1KE62_TRIPS|nr:Diacylglycerol kinase beta [Trichinella pseudospiralis]
MTSSACGRSIFCGKHVKWRKLTPAEFEKLHGYLLYRTKELKQVMVAFQDGGALAKYRRPNETVNFEGFKALLDLYLETDVPFDLCLHLFRSFIKDRTKDEEVALQTTTQSNCKTNRGSLAASTISNAACTPSSRRSSFTLSENKLNIHDYIQRKCRNQEHDSRLFFLGLTNDQSETSTCQCSAVVRLKDIDCYFSLLENGTPEEKLEYTFHLYDADGNGYLDSNEIECIIEQMMSVAEHLAWDTVELKPILRDMLLEIDYDADGTVSLEEWKRGGLTTVPLLVLLGIDSQALREDGTHMWRLKHFNKPTYCNLCMKRLVSFSGKQGLCCTLCKYTVHERCAGGAANNCISTYAKSKRETSIMIHHWVDSNCSERCVRCKKHIKALEGKRCRWCKGEIHQRCLNDWDVKCNLGKLAHHIIPPTSLVPLVLTERRRSSSKSFKTGQNSSTNNGSLSSAMPSFEIDISPDTKPLLVLLNPKSGGKQGTKLYRKLQYLLNPRQVFLLDNSGPLEGLKMFQNISNMNILCCGGDGTVKWVLDAMDQINYGDNRPPVAVLPLGTGNDLSRCLNWGGGFAGKTGNDLIAFLKSIEKSRIVTLDRWETNLIENDDSEKGDAMPNNIITNYFSVGVCIFLLPISIIIEQDASIAHRFHTMREKYPEKFSSRMKNKLWYFEFATSESLQATCKNLHEYVEIHCDGSPLNLDSGPPLEGIAFLNIPSIYGGSNLWGRNASAAKSKRFWGIGSLGLRPSSENLTNSCNLLGNNQGRNCYLNMNFLHFCILFSDMGDKKIEVVGIQSVISMGQVKAGLRTSAKRLAQCSSAIIKTKKRFPMQIDGEPWVQQPCTISIAHKNQVPMLQANKKVHLHKSFGCINQACSES